MEPQSAEAEVQPNVEEEMDDAPPKILPMEAESVRRIVAGQAIYDLASAVKELVDNALDAGAKSVNIRLFNKGLEIVEVSDDGCGVPKASRRYLATPHSTSKIQSFDDIYSSSRTSSLGFRGEALYSLANISTSLIVATRTAQDSLAEKLEFETDGSLKEDSVTQMPRKIGTTVAVVGLLQRLPVRRDDLKRRMKYHRARLLSLIEAYAIFSTGVRIHLMDMVHDAPRNSIRESTVIATPANSTSFAETVSSVFGSKFLAGMAEITIDISSIIVKHDEPQTNQRQWKIHGLVSKAGFVSREQRGVKQSQQLFSVNRRPVDMPKSMVRILNESFRRCNNSDRMAPSCVLEIILPNSEYDINLTPDKRQVLFVHEAEICEILRTQITEFWSRQSGIGVSDNSKEIQRLFLRNDFAGNTIELDENTDEFDHDDKEEEAEGFGYDTRVCPQRRFAFVHDPTQSVEKERLEENRRLEYRQKRHRDSQHLEYQQQRLDQNFEDATGEDSERPLNINEISSLEHGTMQRFAHESADVNTKEVHASLHKNKKPCLMNAMPSVPDENSVSSSPLRQLSETSSMRSDATANITLDSHSQWTELQQFRRVQAQFYSVEDSQRTLANSVEREDSPLREKSRSSFTKTSLPESKLTDHGLERFGFCSIQQKIKDKGVKSHEEHMKNTSETDFEETRTHALQIRSLSMEVNAKIDSHQRSKPQAAARAVTSDSTETRKDSTFASANGTSQSHGTHSVTKLKSWATFDKESITNDIILSAMRDRLAMRDRQRVSNPKQKRCQTSGPTAAPVILPQQSLVLPVVEPGSVEANLCNDIAKTSLSLQASRNATVSLSKSDIVQMQIIGQFNVGFVLARSVDGNLWIFDQHACDERFRFEKLIDETIFHEQKLIAPMPLELSPLQESAIQNNLDIFEANGFRFLYDESKPPHHRFSLTAVPHSGARDGRKAVQFGNDDVISMCEMLGSNDDDEYENDPSFTEVGGTGIDGTGIYGNNAVRRHARMIDTTPARMITRLPKAIAMFASRACRDSVMVGTALSNTEMDRLIKQLSLASQPWICAHGRPTVQHVGNFNSLIAEDENRAIAHVAGPTVTISTQQDVGEVDDQMHDQQ